ncbi:MAG: transposase [Planctomycetota bacterium]
MAFAAVREVCRTNKIEILQGAVSRDHVHVLLSCSPDLFASKIMQYIKGKNSLKLMLEYIRQQDGTEPDGGSDNLQVTKS